MGLFKGIDDSFNYVVSDLNSIFPRYFEHFEEKKIIIKESKTDNKYYIEFELPRVRREEILVRQNLGNTIFVKSSGAIKIEKYISMPKCVDISTMTAKLDLGVLTISFDKYKPIEELKSKFDPIKIG